MKLVRLWWWASAVTLGSAMAQHLLGHEIPALGLLILAVFARASEIAQRLELRDEGE